MSIPRTSGESRDPDGQTGSPGVTSDADDRSVPSSSDSATSTSSAPEQGSPAQASGRSEGRDASGGTLRRLGRGAWVALREVVIVVGLALVLAFVAKTWLVQAFYIPSGSMMNTLSLDDRVIVSKLTPGPFALHRGDIVVFEDPGHWLQELPAQAPDRGWNAQLTAVLTWVGLMPSDSGNHLIKRVIGLPGDRVTCCTTEGKVSVNEVAITEPYLYPGDEPSSQPFDITVPQGKVWVMGDHRSDSADSRFNDTADMATGVVDSTTAEDPRNKTGYYGSVPVDNVVGKAVAIILPISKMGTLSVPDEVFGSVPDADPAPADGGATARPNPSTRAATSEPADSASR